jgi:hypothetical protein
LPENAAATAAGLFAIIVMFGPVPGGRFNPVVSCVDAAFGGLRWRAAAAYLPVQVAGCIGGAVIANMMFALPAVTISAKDRGHAGSFPVRGNRHSRADPGDLRAGPVGRSRSARPPGPTSARGSALRCTAPRSPSDTSSKHIRKACSCRSPRSAIRPASTSSRPPSRLPPPPPKNPTSRRPTSPLSTSAGPAATPSADTAGRLSTSPASPGHRPAPGQHAGLAHP